MVMGEATLETQVAVIGAGPGGYAAAFRAADLGMEVTMIDTEEKPGGVCLFRGCIPSKTFLFLTQLIYDAHRSEEMGVKFCPPEIDLERLRGWRTEVVDRLANGLVGLAKKRDVQYLRGHASLESSQTVRISGTDTIHLKFQHAILATGSHATPLPGIEFREGGRVMSSTGALELADIPKRLLVVGAGYVGMELGSVYASLGSEITVVELSPELLPGADRDLVRPLERRAKEMFAAIHLETKVASLQEHDDRVDVVFDGKSVEQAEQSFDRVLVAIGRRPNSRDIGLENTKVKVNERGFVEVDTEMRTADAHIWAVGDVVGGMMLAHKAMYEGKIAAEVICGNPAAFDARAVPAVVFTDPQIAWAGLMENQAKEQGRQVKVSRFPWGASGRALSMGAGEGMTKMIFDPESGRVLGVGIVGREAGEMISEGVLAIEMGAQAEDVDLSIHPHPTLSETEEGAAGAFLGRATDILPPKR